MAAVRSAFTVTIQTLSPEAPTSAAPWIHAGCAANAYPAFPHGQPRVPDDFAHSLAAHAIGAVTRTGQPRRRLRNRTIHPNRAV